MRFSGRPIVAACAIALLSLAATAAAEESAPPATEAQTATPAEPAAGGQPAAPAEDPNEVICKRLPAETGTRLGKNRKECHTRKEWEDIAEASKATMEKAQTKN